MQHCVPPSPCWLQDISSVRLRIPAIRHESGGHRVRKVTNDLSYSHGGFCTHACVRLCIPQYSKLAGWYPESCIQQSTCMLQPRSEIGQPNPSHGTAFLIHASEAIMLQAHRRQRTAVGYVGDVHAECAVHSTVSTWALQVLSFASRLRTLGCRWILIGPNPSNISLVEPQLSNRSITSALALQHRLKCVAQRVIWDELSAS